MVLRKAGGSQPPPPPFPNTFITGSGFLKTSLHGVKKKSRGVGGGSPPPFANTFITGSERVHMGSVFAGAKILEATLRRAFGISALDIVAVLRSYDFDYY